MARPSSKAAYTLIDISELPAEVRQTILDDAAAGGGEYGIRVVEEVHNGPARAPIFGYYDFEADKWTAAKKELGITAKKVDDSEVVASGEIVTDPRREAALRAAAAAKAGAVADSISAMEEDQVRQVLEGGEYLPAQSQLRSEPMSSVDATAVSENVAGVSQPADHKGSKTENKAKGK